MSDVILEALKTIQDAVDKMSPQEVHLRFELSQYKKEVQQLKQQLEEAVDLLKTTNTYCGGYTQATEFIAKYQGEK